MLFLGPLVVATFLPPRFPMQTVPLGSQTLSLFGQGPPVFFSSGLFGMMPRRLYTELFSHMIDNVTLVVLNNADAVDRGVFDRSADALGVDRLGLFSHSSLDDQLLLSPRLERAVLCDPVVIPSWERLQRLGRTFVESAPHPLDLLEDWTRAQTMTPLGSGVGEEVDRSRFSGRDAFDASTGLVGGEEYLVIRAGNAYDPARTRPIPGFLMPERVRRSRTLTYDDVGHADLLDDRWAELGTNALPWMKGTTRNRRSSSSFLEWTRHAFVDDAQDARLTRQRYRQDVAVQAVGHFLHA